MDFRNALTKILGNDKSIEEVHIDYRVIDEIVKIAINADPNEYVALLSGDIDKDILKITGLIFLPFKASSSSAVMEVFMMPMTTNAVGSVHSHPGPSAQPSQADLTFFGKNGYFHMIICRPYSESSIRAYDPFGNPLTFYVKDLGDEIEIKQWEDLDIDKELFDEEFIKELEKLDDENNFTDTEKDIINDNQKDIIDTKEDITENRKEEETELSHKNNNQTQVNSQPINQAMLNLEFEIKGKKVVKQIPLPPEYEPGDHVDVDIRTDKTPNDDIDEIIVNVRKAPQPSKQNNKIITVTPQKIKSNQQKIELEPQEIEQSPEEENVPVQEQTVTDKSTEEIENEIKQMEADIARLKEENERLKKDL